MGSRLAIVLFKCMEEMVLRLQARKQSSTIAGPEAVDESVRCRMSGICEGALACPPGSRQPRSGQLRGTEELLGCITNSTERQGKVVEAMRWTWKGYR